MPTILTILKSLAVVAVCAFALYDRLVDVEAQASNNAKAILLMQKDVAAIGRIEEAVKYQNRRTDDIINILTSIQAGK